MKNPFTNKEMSVQREWRKMNFRKDEFDILFHFYKCEDTGEQFEDNAFAELNSNQLLNQYREKHAIPFPGQIKKIRQKYALSAKKMSEILGLGINSYRQYEAGEMPNQSNAKLIQLVDDPKEFKKLVKICGSLENKAKEAINQKIGAIIEINKSNKFEIQLAEYFLGLPLANKNTGYKFPDKAKFSEMLVFFAKELQPWKTKLNKLLFYADFSMFQQTGFSISGLQYRAIQMGPVPNNFNGVYEFMVKQNDFTIQEIHFSNGETGELLFQNPIAILTLNCFLKRN
jgi:putative zinc finger/helix-turn-helix YgiT family protein